MIIFALMLASAATPAPDSPQIFAPGIISSGAADAALTISPDGQEVFFERSNGQSYAIMTSHRTGSTWSKPKVASFSGRWLDLESAMSADASYLIFASNRPPPGTVKAIDGFYLGKLQLGKGGALWRVDRRSGHWGSPYRLPNTVNIGTSIYEPSLAANGDLYFQSSDSDGKQFHLYIAKAGASGYSQAAQIDLHGPTESSDMDPAIAPDGSFLVFSSDRHSKENRLFISFHTAGGWSEPRVLSPAINSGSVGDPRLDLKHRRLYFVSRRLAPAIGDIQADLDAAKQWNNGLSNIWSVHFEPQAWRKAAS